MGRILAIDYGKKRSGLAWTDPLQLIATGLDSVATAELEERLRSLVEKEPIEAIVLGYPRRLDGGETHATAAVSQFKKRLEKQFPGLEVVFWDEQFTSKMALDAMIAAGVKKKKRREKELINQVSATIILQDFLEHKAHSDLDS